MAVFKYCTLLMFGSADDDDRKISAPFTRTTICIYKCGLRRPAVSVRLSVCLSARLCVCPSHASIVSKWLTCLKTFLPSGSPIILVFFLIPGVNTQFQGKPRQWERKVHEGWKKLRFSTEITVYQLETVRDRPMVTMERY